MALITGSRLTRANINFLSTGSESSGTDRDTGLNYYFLGDSMYFYASIKDVFLADDRCTYYLYKSNLDRSGWTLITSIARDGGQAFSWSTNLTSGAVHNDQTIRTWRVLLSVPYGDGRITLKAGTRGAYITRTNLLSETGVRIYYWNTNCSTVVSYVYYSPAGLESLLAGSQVLNKEQISFGGYL